MCPTRRTRCLYAYLGNGSLLPWMLMCMAVCVAATVLLLRAGGLAASSSESEAEHSVSDVLSAPASNHDVDGVMAPRDLGPQGTLRTRAEAKTEGPLHSVGAGMVRVEAVKGVAGWPPVLDVHAVDHATDSSSPIVANVGAQPFRLPVGRYELRVNVPYRLAMPCEFRVVDNVLTEVHPELARVHSWVIADCKAAVGLAGNVWLIDNHAERREFDGRLLFLRFVTDPHDDLRLRVHPEVLECIPASLPWDGATHAVAAISRPTLRVTILGHSRGHRMCSMQRVGSVGAWWRMTPWRSPDEAIPRLVPPDGEVRIVLDTPAGFFGPIALTAASDVPQSVTVPSVAMVDFVREEGSQPGTGGRLLIGADARVDFTSDVVTADNLTRYEPAKWLLCKKFAWSDAQSESIGVFRGVPFAVEFADRNGRVKRCGPYRVDAERATITLAAGLEVDFAVRVRVRVAPEMRKPMRVVAAARDGDPRANVVVPVVHPDNELHVQCPAGEQILLTGQYQQEPDGPWLAFDSALVARHSGEVEVSLDATHLPVAPRAGVLAGVGPRPGGLQVAFHPSGAGRLTVVGGLEMPGRPSRRSGNLIADVDGAGRFMLEVAPGAYEVHVTDPFGRDVGMRSVRVSVDDSFGPLHVVSGPRDAVVLMPIVAAGRTVDVHGPEGVVTGIVDDQAGLRLYSAACGEYRVFEPFCAEDRPPIAVFHLGSDGTIVAGKKR